MKVNSKTTKKTTKKNEREYIEVTSFAVSNARVVSTKKGDDLIFFTLNLNGIFINNCKVASGKNGDFISFPQYKGSNGEYYNTIYAPVSPEDTDKILAEVEAALNQTEVPLE